MDSNPNQPGYNLPGIKESPGKDVRSEETLKWNMLKVSKSIGQIQLIDQFFYDEDATSNLPMQERDWGLRYNDIISTLALASTTNAKSGRKYNFYPIMLKAYERKKSLYVTSKSIEGWAFLNALKHEYVQTLHQQSIEHVSNEQKKSGIFSGNNNQNMNNETNTNNYGKFRE